MGFHIWFFPLAVALLLLWMDRRQKRRRMSVINHRINHKNKEMSNMKALAEKFIGKECLIYTIASENSSVKGFIKEVTDDGILVEKNGNLQAVNLEYVTRIQEWPRDAKGRKKTFFE